MQRVTKGFLAMFALPLVASCADLIGLNRFHDAVCKPGEKQTCQYHGPQGTEGVGVCKAATQTCAEDGTAWSACEGEVVPNDGGEICTNTLDDDCDGVVNNGCPCTPGEASACYDGPAGTETVGACHGGMRVCNADGMTYGPCMDQTLPAAEACGSTADTNCDGFLCGQTEWAEGMGAGLDEGDAIAVDSMGNVYVAGGFSGSLQLGGKTLISALGRDIFVAKLDPKGNVLWAQQFGDAAEEYATAIAVDTAGDVVVTGTAGDAVDFGGGPVNGQIFAVMLDASGNHVWSTSCGGSMGIGGTGVAFDASGDVVLVGSFGGTANCGDAAHPSAGYTDILMAKLSRTDGHALWSKSFGGSNPDTVKGVAVDKGGNISITGTLGGAASFGGSSLNAGIYFARFSASGAHTASDSWGGNSLDMPTAIAVDSTGSPVIVGNYYSNTLDFGTGALPAPPNLSTACFVFRPLSMTPAKSFVPASCTGVAVDVADDLVVTGDLAMSVDFGGGDVSGDVFAAKLDGKGNHVWSRGYAKAGMFPIAYSNAVAAGPAGETVITGSFSESLDLGLSSGPVAGPTGIDKAAIFVAKIAP